MPSLFGMNYAPKPDAQPYLERAQTQRDEQAEVTVAVLTSAECSVMFGVPLANRGIQAVWVRVVNRSPSAARLLMTKISSEYFTAREAAGNCHFSTFKRLIAYGVFIWWLLPIIALALPFKILAVQRANRRMNDCFQRLGFPLKTIKTGESAEGIVFTPLEFGTKVIDVGLLIGGEVHEYLFTVEMSAPSVDHQNAILSALESQETIDCDLDTLKQKLREMPPATTNASGRRSGDPVNLVVIGNFSQIIAVFASRWDQTEIITVGSCWKTVKAFLFGSEYRYSPVSALYLFNRPQDFALQRIRGSINERLHLRLWSTPLRYEGQAVWVGQVSRDIGVRFTFKTWNLTTHRIDSDVDEARDYVLEDLFEAQRISAGGYIDGLVACTRESPRHNLTGDPYFTNGQRAVLVVTETRAIPKLLNWV